MDRGGTGESIDGDELLLQERRGMSAMKGNVSCFLSVHVFVFFFFVDAFDFDQTVGCIFVELLKNKAVYETDETCPFGVLSAENVSRSAPDETGIA